MESVPTEFVTAAEEQVAPYARRLRSRALGNRVHESLLVLPLVLLATALLIEEIAAEADRRFPGLAGRRLTLPPDAAVALLSTIAGATITTAGVVFSLFVVTLQLASGQFSPRVLRTFWRDQFGQVLIGLLLATFAFCVTALTQFDATATRAPTLTVLLALLLAFASILVIVVYLNRITRAQYVGRILSGIADETLRLIHDQSGGPRAEVPDVTTLGPPLVVMSAHDGWVQQSSYPIALAATPPGSVVRIDTRVGAYLAAGESIATIWTPAGHSFTPAQAAQVTALVRHALVVGNARTMQQDIDFGLRQLNDIGLRALSPAENDPTTAIEAVLRLGSVMRRLVRTELPGRVREAPEGRTLLTPWEPGHAQYVTHAFGQQRFYGAGSAQVALALVRVLRMLREASLYEEASRALDEELALLLAQCERADLLPADLEMIRQAAVPSA